jgi:RNA-binding protein YhbY
MEWKCSDCSVTLKSRHNKLGKEYNQRRKKGMSSKPVVWIRKGGYRDFLFFEIGKKLYAFRSLDVERLERDEILAIPVFEVLG